MSNTPNPYQLLFLKVLSEEKICARITPTKPSNNPMAKPPQLTVEATNGIGAEFRISAESAAIISAEEAEAEL